jgi:citrate synthase
MLITESRLTVDRNGRSLSGMTTQATIVHESSRKHEAPQVHEGLQGVVATRTRLSRVDGDAGRLTIAGYDVGEIAPRVPFEAMAFLLLEDRLPRAAELEGFRSAIAEHRVLGGATLALLREAARQGAAPIDVLRLGVASLVGGPSTPVRLLGALPAIAAAYARLLDGKEPQGAAVAGLSSSEFFLASLSGEAVAPGRARALDTYWNTVADHGLNASTFTARVIASTGSDLSSAIEGALGALKGPLHGGAPGPALDALQALRRRGGDLAEATRTWAEQEIAGGRRLMGFGHRIYRVRDPRAQVLEHAAEALLEGTSWLADARVHEAAVLSVLGRLKPGRPIATNVEFYTALLLHGIGLTTAWFTPVFALGRLAGWLAHVREQVDTGRLIRPESHYVGADGRRLEAVTFA